MPRERVRRLVAGGMALGVAAILIVALSAGDSGHRFSLVVPGTSNVTQGQPVHATGETIGSVDAVDPVDRGRAARITVRIDDEDYWPLPSDSKVEIRLGGTASFSNQYLLVTRGSGDKMLDDDGELPRKNVEVPVDLEDVLTLLDRPLRADIRELIANGAAGIAEASPPLRRALRRAPSAVRQASHVMSELTQDQEILEGLVVSTGRVVDGVDRSSPDLGALIDGAAQTFDAIGSESVRLEETIETLPAALRQTRATLARADVTLRDVGSLAGDLAPAAEELQRTAAPLSSTLMSLREVTPPAAAALQRSPGARKAGRLLFALSDASPALRSTAKRAAAEVACIRPYTPELVLFGTTWGDFISGHDEKDHYLRAQVQSYLPSAVNASPLTPGQLADAFPGLEYGYPRPPGALAGQPWFQPKCGAGRDAIDPHQDQEAQNFDPDDLPPAPESARGRGR